MFDKMAKYFEARRKQTPHDDLDTALEHLREVDGDLTDELISLETTLLGCMSAPPAEKTHDTKRSRGFNFNR